MTLAPLRRYHVGQWEALVETPGEREGEHVTVSSSLLAACALQAVFLVSASSAEYKDAYQSG
ncbi:MAG: hypothetical protein AUJ92_08010 [Armatimonadetes bacterium CG2_30_59_28]|nr:MAG: hypothetical protein AUJ92_08010 [Armatimonadetes bacterium CG2_30_59_28]PIU60870.1 MAG: hypothetical protein COS85_22380 [Armatimonadetes bacterium CG07_land_8_20_14_0_80_59_28]PIX42897.1 MAG: hypothetical protein COZ56_08325 [Armatimonadetes bacterium CG_4_8_14_3_um_filter_58_9]PJB74716.1 MAG: hypothetical protein CO095_04520 [Armatimonadetes bacterium CG_4_9_14_3_um_filter_58_7]